MKSIGQRIREARRGLALSQQGLAQRARIHRNTIRNYEKGVTEPRGPYLAALERALGTRLKEKETRSEHTRRIDQGQSPG
mgnify:CR=1 FL=1